MNTIKAEFFFDVTPSIRIKVEARCSYVDNYGAEDLRLKFFGENDERLEMVYDKAVFADIEEQAVSALLDVKYSPEVFKEDGEYRT